jgi:hypothetical protein
LRVAFGVEAHTLKQLFGVVCGEPGIKAIAYFKQGGIRRWTRLWVKEEWIGGQG